MANHMNIKCEIENKPLIQLIENTAHRIYSEGQRVENDRIRALVRRECDKFLDAQKQDEGDFSSDIRAGASWSKEEDNLLRDGLASFFVKAAKEHGRSYGAISSRIARFYSPEG